MARRAEFERAHPKDQPPDPADILTIDELAARWKVKRWTVFEMTRGRWLARNPGKRPIPCHRVGKFVRFYWSEVSRWLEEQ
jgi:hypothetical protein